MLAEAAGGLEAEEGGGEDHARTLHAAQLVRQHLPGEIVSAVKRSIGSTTGCTITEKAPTRAFS